MLTYVQTMGVSRLSVDSAVASARTQSSKTVAKANKPRPANLSKNVELSKKMKSVAAKKASSDGFQKALSDVTKRANKLRSAAEGVQGNERATRRRDVQSSNAEVASVRVEAGQSVGIFELKVKQVAAAQENRGEKLKAETSGIFDSGRQFVEAQVGSETKRLSVSVAPNEQTSISLEKMATAINESELSLEADIELSGDGGGVQLVIAATQTGTDAAFSIRDVVGSLVEKTGAGNVSQPAGNANFSVNGKDQELPGNQFVVDSGRIEINLEQTGDTEISVVRNHEAIFGAVDRLLVEMNHFRDSLVRSKASLNEDIAVEFDRHMEEVAENLESLGLEFTTNAGTADAVPSTLSLDSASLLAVAQDQPGEFENAIAGEDGLAGRMVGFAQVVEKASAVELVGLTDAEVSQTGSSAQGSLDSGTVVNDAV